MYDFLYIFLLTNPSAAGSTINADPGYYDYDFDYYSEEDENYKKDWTRFNWIDTEFWGDDFNSLENRFIEREKEENQKKYKKPKEIIKKKKIN